MAKDDLTDEVVENRERLERFEDNPINEVDIDIPTEQQTVSTESITVKTSTTKEVIENGTTVSSNLINSDEKSSIYLRNLLISMLIGTDPSEAVVGHRFGTGNATSSGTDRREVQSLQTDETSNLNTNVTINVGSNSIGITEEITNIEDVSFNESDISEIGVESDAGNLFQYILD
jgi:hypothetical protein